MTSTVSIDERFCGPPGSAQGGYVSALAAQWIDGPAEVTLRAPTPLAKPLRVQRDDGRVTLFDEERLIVEARPATVAVDLPAPVSLDEARHGPERYPWRDEHPYPTCFVCGPQRFPGDGLGIFPGPVDSGSMFAAPWIPERSLADAEGNVRPEFVWAALDCPSGIVTDVFGDVGQILLGRLTADLRQPVGAESPHVVQAWPIARDGRKLHAASALFTAEGELRALARALWIELRSG